MMDRDGQKAKIRRPHRPAKRMNLDYDDSTHKGVVYEVSAHENVMQGQVRAFMEKFDQVRADGRRPALRDTILRAHLIREEAREVDEAIAAGDLVLAVDGLCDLLYVTFGTLEAFGVDAATVFDEVHRTNMLKEPDNKDDKGKVLKPEGWAPPRIAEMLELYCE